MLLLREPLSIVLSDTVERSLNRAIAGGRQIRIDLCHEVR